MNKKIINISLILFIAFILYNTLIPFNFNMNGSSFMQLLKSADWALFVHQGNRAALTDIAGNILLFIPLGLLLFLWGRQYKIRGILFLSVLAGFVLSTFIEVLQLFIFQRNSSVTDIFNNTLGTFLGAFGAAIYFKTIAEVSNRFLRSLLKEQPLAIILVAILGFQIVGAIIPFNVSITVSDLIKSLKKINIIPFHNQSLSLLLFHRPLNFDAETFNWFAFVENILFWSVWGYISGLCYHFYWKFRRFGSIIYFGVIIVPPLLIEFLQIFIVARFSDVNDILSAWTGIVLGLALCLFFKPFARYDGNEIWRSLKGALILYYIFIIFAGLQPFDYNFSADGPIHLVTYKALVPFYSYFKKTSIWNIYDLINSLFYFIPISLFLSIRWFREQKRWVSMYFLNGLLGFLTGVFIEIVQLFSTVRVAEITDALLYGLGGLLGTFLLYYYFREILPAYQPPEEPVFPEKI